MSMAALVGQILDHFETPGYTQSIFTQLEKYKICEESNWPFNFMTS